MIPSTRTTYNKNKSNESKLDNCSIDDENSNMRLATINSDIEKLYKKYSDIRKKRLSKEKTQQILVNRIKYLKNEVKRSVSKKEKEKEKNMNNNQKNFNIQMKIEESYIYNNNNKGKRNIRNIRNKQKKNLIYNQSESLTKISLNDNEIFGKIHQKINYANKENDQNICNTISNLNNIENILKKNRYNIGNNNSNNNIYIIINNPKNFVNENSSNNNLGNNIYTIENNQNNNLNRQNRNIKNLHRKYKSENNFINLTQKGENIILMKADGNKIEDIINKINKNNNNINKNNKYKKVSALKEQSEINKKINKRNINTNLLKKDEEFIRPNFLNLYNNEDTTTTKQQIDINTFNKSENSCLHTAESFLTNNIINEKNAEEINSIKQNNKKKTVFNDIINKEKNNNNLFSNQTISYNSHKSDIKENKKENINLNNKEKIKTDFVKNYINKLNETNNLDIRKINSLKQNIPKSNTNSNFLKLKNINPEKSLSNHLRNDSYCNSIENKRKILGLEFKPNIKRELSIQTEKNLEKKNRLIQRIKKEKKLNNLYERDKLIKVKKMDDNKKRFNGLKKNIKINNIRNLIKNRTVTNFSREKNNISLTTRNEGGEHLNKKFNYHIYI